MTLIEALERENLKPEIPEFNVGDTVKVYNKIVEGLQPAEDAWNKMFAEYCEKFPEDKARWEKYHTAVNAEALYNNDEFWAYEDKAVDMRAATTNIIKYLNNSLVFIIFKN